MEYPEGPATFQVDPLGGQVVLVQEEICIKFFPKRCGQGSEWVAVIEKSEQEKNHREGFSELGRLRAVVSALCLCGHVRTYTHFALNVFLTVVRFHLSQRPETRVNTRFDAVRFAVRTFAKKVAETQ